MHVQMQLSPMQTHQSVKANVGNLCNLGELNLSALRNIRNRCVTAVATHLELQTPMLCMSKFVNSFYIESLIVFATIFSSNGWALFSVQVIQVKIEVPTVPEVKCCVRMVLASVQRPH